MSYTIKKIENNKYITIKVVETVESEKEIIPAGSNVFKVIATGAYSQIKVSDGIRTFIMTNPFTNYFGDIKDSRIQNMLVATNPDFDKVLDMTNAKFDLLPEVMANLHNKIYMGKDEYWVDLTEKNLDLCK